MTEETNIRILLCVANENLALVLCEALSREPYLIDVVTNAEKGLQRFLQKSYDLCIIDAKLPPESGEALVRNIRDSGSDVLILCLTEKNVYEEILSAYHAGADDTVMLPEIGDKPLLVEVLVCKINRMMWRIREARRKVPTNFQLGQITFDSAQQTLTTPEGVTRLSTRESGVLALLCLHPNKLVERNYILKVVWQDDSYFSARSLSVYINHLRKLLAIEPSLHIMNVHARGYKLVQENE